jgi:hypothetical protein
MVKRPRGGDEETDDGDVEGEPEPRGGSGGGTGSIRGGEVQVFGKAQVGRPGAATGNGTSESFTPRSGTLGGIPDGPPTIVRPRQDDEGRRSIEMENSAAVILAARGWRITQNPTPDEVARARLETGDRGNPGKNPDFMLEGRVFDCYSPTFPEKSPRGIWSEVRDGKINKHQTQRVVINLEDWRGDLSALRTQFATWPMPGLKEAKVITPDGEVVQLDLPPTTD